MRLRATDGKSVLPACHSDRELSVRSLGLGHFLSGPSPKLSLSGLTSETRAAPPRGAVIYL